MANSRNLKVSLLIGGAISPTLTRALGKAGRDGARTGTKIADGLNKAQVGAKLSADVIKYQRSLDRLTARQGRTEKSSARLKRAIVAAQGKYKTAETAARRYGIEIGNVADEHRRLSKAAAISNARIARGEQRSRNRDTRGRVQGDIVGAAAPALLLAQPLKQAIEFETTLAEINKVVDFKKPDGLNRMSEAILKLSTDERIPLAASGIGNIVAAAGQAGIARSELVQFTRDAAKIGVAFDLSGAQAGAAMTGVRSIFGLNQKQAVLVADSYNHLSNNMDATAGQILRITQRAGSLGKLVGFSGEQVGALGATFLALKTPPEVAATGINALLTKLATADKQPAKFQEALEGLGLTASGLKEGIKRDAQGTLTSFLETVEGAEDKIGVLADLFGAEYADDIAKLVGSMDVYRKALSLVADQTKFAGSAQKEYEARAKTTANDLVILKNQTTRLAITTGRLLLPGLKAATGFLGSLATQVTGVSEKFPLLTKVVGFTVVALVALKIAGLGAQFAGTLFSDAWLFARGALAKLHPTVIKNTAALVKMRAASILSATGIKGLAAGGVLGAIGSLKTLALSAIPLVITAMNGLSLAMLFNPVGLTVAAIAAGALLIIKFWKPIKAFFGGVFDGIKAAMGPETVAVFDTVGHVIGWVGSLIKGLFAPAMSTAAELDGFAGVGRDLGAVLGWVLTPLKLLVKALTWVTTKVSGLLEKMDLFGRGKAAVQTMGDGFVAGSSWLLSSVKSVFGKVDEHMPKSDAKVGPLSTLTASGVSLVRTLGEGVTKGRNQLVGPLANVLRVSGAPAGPGPLAGLDARPRAGQPGPLAGTRGGGGGIHVDMSGMTIHASTAADAAAIGDSLEQRVKKVVEQLERKQGASRRGALHDGDRSDIASL